MKTRTERKRVIRLIWAGIICGVLLNSTLLTAAAVNSDKDKTKAENTTEVTSVKKAIEDSNQDLIREDEEEIKLERWMYEAKDPLWKSILKENKSKEEVTELEAWMTDPESWSTSN